jgi:DNA-binding CsgD family transcriptional regulator/tetratricopeptide (TPR) repeat protein
MPADTALVGRDVERDRLRAALADAAGGAPQALVIRGDPGVGKTRLLDAAVADAAVAVPGGFRLIRVAGHEAESEIPYAALSLLLGPLLDGLGALPRPQAAALEGALNLGPGGTGDRLAVGVATLGLLAQAADERPLLLGVDDAHCLDLPTLEALVFSVRRMRAEPIAVLVTARSPADTSPAIERWLAGLPELVVDGLDLGAARRLLGPHASLSRATWQATGGNPLALLELPATGARALPVEPIRLSTRLVHAYERRLSGLPEATREALLLVAVAGSTDDALTEALAEQGLGLADLEPAEEADLLDHEGPVSGDHPAQGRGPRFRHPLIRSAVYHAAAPARKRAAHQALAAVHGRREGPAPAERRAFHLAAATPGADEEVAAQVTAAARSAAARNNHVTALALLERAARLSPTGPARTRRLLEAALTAQTAGSVADATPLLDLALLETDDPELITAARHLQCRVQMWSGQPTEARDELLHLADRTRAADPGRSAAMRSQAALLSLNIGDQPLGLGAAARAAAESAGLPPAQRLPITLVHALALALAGDSDGARALLAACEPALAATDPLTIDQLPVVAANTYASVEEPEQARRWLETGVRSTRAAGAVGLLPFLLTWLASACWRDGDWATGLTHAHAAVELAQETGWATEEPEALAALATLEAGLGMEDACREHAARALRLGPASGIHIVEARAERALGLLELGAGHPEVAAAHLRVTGEFALAHGLGSPVLLDWAGDLAEAYTRAGMPERALRALAVLEREAAAPGRPAAHAVALRCTGLLRGDEAEAADAFTEALRWHGRAHQPFEEARTRLCLGEHLRRRRRLAAARETLGDARRAFARLGAAAWVARAENELRAAGTRTSGHRRPDVRPVEMRPEGPVGPAHRGPAPLRLTPQELQVALVVAAGATNVEAGAQLFLSPKTIEYHLSNAYRKLGIRSRAELVRAVLSAPAEASA